MYENDVFIHGDSFVLIHSSIRQTDGKLKPTIYKLKTTMCKVIKTFVMMTRIQ